MTTTLLLQVLLLQACSIVSSTSFHCSQLRIPAANVGHALVHVDSFDPIENQARAACKANGVPNYKCESVRRELRETLQEMAQLAIREAVVNVSLDHSLVYEIYIENDTTQDTMKAPEPLTVYPEEPLADTLSDYCTRYNLDAVSCENARVGITDLVARDWGCDDPETVEEKAFVEIPVTLDDVEYSLKLDTTTDVMVDAANFCIEKRVAMAECGELFRIVRDQVNHLQANETTEDVDKNRGEHDKRNEGGSYGVPSRNASPRLLLDSPISTRLYPKSERIYIKPSWELPSGEVYSEEVCLSFEGPPTTSMRCLTVPLKDTLYITANTMPEGYHLIYFTDKSGEKILAATTFQVVVPNVELLEIFTSPVEADKHSDAEYLVAKIRATLFDPFDSMYRVCIRLDHSFECLDPEWMAVDEREFRHGTRTDPFHQSVTFRAPLDHVPLEQDKLHQICVVLVSKNNKALSISETISFNAAPSVNQETTYLHVLDPRLHTPQKPQICPESLLVPRLQWICELWRHEWGILSQNGEDGILHEIFRWVGTEHKSYVEFGTENGNECNTRFLREVDGWTGLLMDSRHENEKIELHREFITRENFMPLLADKYKRLVPRDLDLISIDVDFNDYWLLCAIDLTRVRPRVVVVEVNSHIASNEARTVEYDASDDGSGGWDGFSAYFGASVAAFYHWGTRNGYSLVYCESHGVNCFLVRNDILGENVSAVLGPEQLQNPPNFFGQGWNYPNVWQPHHKWVWL